MTVGIRSVGAYAPSHRITAEAFEDAWGSFDAAGIEEKAVPAADEDALTIGHEAAIRALDAAGVDGTSVAFLALASTTPPVAEEDLTARLGSFLGIPDGATRHVFTGSTRAGTRALIAGLDADPSGGVGLVVASDCPRGEPGDGFEHAAGAGAAAFVLDTDAPGRILDRAGHATPYPGTRFRRPGSDAVEGLDVTSYDRQAFRETLAAAVDGLEAPGDVDAAAVQAPDGKLPYRAAGALGVDTDALAACETVSELGDTGAGSVPLGLARAIADGHERILAAAFGSGAGADALLVESDGVPTDLALEGRNTVGYPAYLRLRGDITGGPPSGGGAYVSMPSWRRTIAQRHRLVAGRCPDCEALAFPPDGACPECSALVDFDPVRLPGTGEIEAVTSISRGGAPPEFAEQQAKGGDFAVAVVAFDGEHGGETVSAPAGMTGDPAAPDVGDRVEAVIRRIYTQEGVTRYGFKVKLAD